MRRCNAPSQVAKRNSLSPLHSGSKLLRQEKSITKNRQYEGGIFDDEKEQRPPYYSPGTSNITSLSCDTSALSPHEQIIRRLLNKPFKVPIPNYSSLQNSKSLGLKRNGARQSLHDPFAENALVLFVPPEISEHDKLKLAKG